MNFDTTLQGLQDLEPTVEDFRASVFHGLGSMPKTLPCKFFYDAQGSHLFDRICELPEYYPTRTECALLAAHAEDIAACIGPQVELIEFGSGAGVKIRLLLAALNDPTAYVPVDISRTHLMRAANTLAQDFPGLRVAPVCADYTNPFVLPPLPGPPPERRVGFFPGSTIGNFTPQEATDFLRDAAHLLGPGSMMIVGVDLPKDPAILQAAYDDPAGVTAAFNLNLLRRINRELGADFDLGTFCHEARWNRQASRVEMHLVSQARQTVHMDARRFDFVPGESIHTENSYKFSIDAFGKLARAAGYAKVATWTDPAALFSVHVLEASNA
jgi:dimethylhistidine N-methyltransferase